MYISSTKKSVKPKFGQNRPQATRDITQIVSEMSASFFYFGKLW